MSTLRTWSQDLRMGARFAFGGGREGWTRTLLTGIGVGLGAALLLLTTALPGALAARDLRSDARSTWTAPTAEKAGPGTLLFAEVQTTFRNQDLYGGQLRPEGPDAPLPPGLKRFPGPGELAVSPALKDLLGSPEGRLLRDRLDGPITQTISDDGLIGPGELAFYLGSDTLRDDSSVKRITGFANDIRPEKLDPVLMLLLVMVFVALLMPVAVFVAAAVRFGGEARDRRLAALRLVGADSRMARRIAAGEALAGAVTGLVLGAGFFYGVRQFADRFTVLDRSVFPADLTPSPWLAVLVALAVPVAAVAVTLFALRGVVIEPLGVVRTAKPARRRIWWRLVMPVAGLGLLVPLMGRGREHGDFNQWQVIGGVVLLLVGITAILPWLVEAVVSRLSGGGVAWQLAVRRLQLSSGTAARLVNGIAVAVAGAIALQMLFAGVESDYTKATGQDPSRAAMSVWVRGGQDPDTGIVEQVRTVSQKLRRAEGVTGVTPLTTVNAVAPKDPDRMTDLTIASCPSLREIADLPSCKDGDTFLLRGGYDDATAKALAVPGDRLLVGGSPEGAPPVSWTVPKGVRAVPARPDPAGTTRNGILATPGAAPQGRGVSGYSSVYVQLDPAAPDAMEQARTAAFKADPLATVMTLKSTEQSNRFASIRTGLYVGAVLVLLLIGASMLVSQLEQLRERKKLLSALVAFGTRRSTLSLSVLWQTALPIGLGLGLATATGLALGAVLMRMTAVPVSVDWASVAWMSGTGAAVVLLVTALSLPPLLRLMRPDGLRTE
ncbi:ABC transporter permease [Streptomyces bambusae]|uniref:FtsX-like permease family protein n=1 Tax=Streptomyces bambusae TaxID=1550616 RepID=UPI001CFF6C41|nr:FtsX-like permease family protein [Streptomyces bambusae]MCB5169797.1 ABC transporter permease [Streptomyces bambusae]